MVTIHVSVLKSFAEVCKLEQKKAAIGCFNTYKQLISQEKCNERWNLNSHPGSVMLYIYDSNMKKGGMLTLKKTKEIQGTNKTIKTLFAGKMNKDTNTYDWDYMIQGKIENMPNTVFLNQYVSSLTEILEVLVFFLAEEFTLNEFVWLERIVRLKKGKLDHRIEKTGKNRTERLDSKCLGQGMEATRTVSAEPSVSRNILTEDDHLLLLLEISPCSGSQLHKFNDFRH